MGKRRPAHRREKKQAVRDALAELTADFEADCRESDLDWDEDFEWDDFDDWDYPEPFWEPFRREGEEG